MFFLTLLFEDSSSTNEQDIGFQVHFGIPTDLPQDSTRNEEISPEPPEITTPFEVQFYI